MKHLIAALVLLAIAQLTMAQQITAFPNRVTPDSAFMLDINGVFPTPCALDGDQIDSEFVDGTLVITLHLIDQACIQIFSPLHRAFGAFHVDSATVQAGESFGIEFRTEQTGTPLTIGQTMVDVVASPDPILSPISALYWDREVPGLGVSLEYHAGRAFLAAYSYDAPGQSAWYVAQGNLNGAVFEAELLSTAGGPCLLCEFFPVTTFTTQSESQVQLVVAGPALALMSVGERPGRALILKPLALAEVNSEGTIAGSVFVMPDLTGRWLFTNENGEPLTVVDLQPMATGFADAGVALFANADRSVEFSCGFAGDAAYFCQLRLDDVVVAEADDSEVSHNAIRSSSMIGVRLN